MKVIYLINEHACMREGINVSKIIKLAHYNSFVRGIGENILRVTTTNLPPTNNSDLGYERL